MRPGPGRNMFRPAGGHMCPPVGPRMRGPKHRAADRLEPRRVKRPWSPVPAVHGGGAARGHLDFGIVAHREQMPDLSSLTEWLREALTELQAPPTRVSVK